jgi:uncharacterized protein (TIGR03118 family)
MGVKDAVEKHATVDWTEREAIARAQRGDATAFEYLYRVHCRRVYDVCLRVTTDAVAAEVLTERTFLQLFRTIGAFCGELDFSIGVRRVTLDTVLMHLSREKPAEIPVDDLEHHSSIGEGPSEPHSSDKSSLDGPDQFKCVPAIRELSLDRERLSLIHADIDYRCAAIARPSKWTNSPGSQLLQAPGWPRPLSLFLSWLLFLAVVLTGTQATAQTIAYRQTNLASNFPAVANNVTPELVNPWGIAFLSNQPFFIANNQAGRVTSLDATGLGVSPGVFIVSNSAGTGFEDPTGIVADQNSFFGGPSDVRPFILVTDQGTAFVWGPDAQGDLPQQATLVLNNSRQGAVYKGVAILNSSLTAPALAVTDFHAGFIETFLPGFEPVALPGSFTDPSLPAGYAPFGIQVIGSQIFVTYAVQDAAKHDPIIGSGNGIVNIFDMDGNFVRRFATAGALNAPWGITQASANFGPFSNAILIGNVGDGTINAFDPTTGHFLGALIDGDGNDIVEVGLHALAFRADGFGAPDALYFTSQFNAEQNGLFGVVTTGLVSTTRVSAPNTAVNTSVTITATIAAGSSNSGVPTGTVTFLDGSTRLGTTLLVNGFAAVDAILSEVGIHNITALYSGDGVFLPSSGNMPEQVTGHVTTTTLSAPTNASPTSPVTLIAKTDTQGSIPTGNVQFLDTLSGSSHLIGQAPLDASGTASVTVNLVGLGVHSVIAQYEGNESLASSDSATVNITVAEKDFSLGVAPPTATVVAGQSTQFMLTVTPAGGFGENVSFTCSPTNGITCIFSPAMVTPANEAVGTRLTVITSAGVPQYGLLISHPVGPWAPLAALALFGFVFWRGGKFRTVRASLTTVTATLAIVALGFTISGCGGGYSSAKRADRGTTLIKITAQAGTISHTTTVSVTVQ